MDLTKKIDNITFDNQDITCLYLDNEVIWQKFLEDILWKPLLNGETGASYQWSYSESNGEGYGKGFVLSNGFPNRDLWQLSFDFKHDRVQYTGICFLAEVGRYNGKGGSSYALTSWEGGWPGGQAYATYETLACGFFDIVITKLDDTHVNVYSQTLNRDTTVEVSWLSNALYLSCGARHNEYVSSGGTCRIKNVKAIHINPPIEAVFYSTNDIELDKENFVGRNMIVSWENGKSSHDFTYSYSDNLSERNVLFYNVDNLKAEAFSEQDNANGLSDITIPQRISFIGDYCFMYCNNLSSINLKWVTPETIITYNNTWLDDANSHAHFIIPYNTKSLYIAAHYPESKLVEDNFNGDITLNTDKSRIAIGDSFSLVATVTSDVHPVNGCEVCFMEENNNDYNVIGYATVNQNGVAILNQTAQSVGSKSYMVSTENVTSTKTIDILKIDTNLTITPSANLLYYTQQPQIRIDGRLYDAHSQPLNNESITLNVRRKSTNTSITIQTTTDNNGYYVENINLIENQNSLNDTESFEVYTQYSGDNIHNSCVSVYQNITYSKAPTKISINNDGANDIEEEQYYYRGDIIQNIEVVSNYGVVQPSSLSFIYDNNIQSLYPANNKFSVLIPNDWTTEKIAVISFSGDSLYSNATRTIIIKPPYFNKLSLSINNKNLVVQYQDKNGLGLANLDVGDTEFYVTGTLDVTMQFSEQRYTDSNGMCTLDLSSWPNGSYTIEAYFNQKSATISFEISGQGTQTPSIIEVIN